FSPVSGAIVRVRGGTPHAVSNNSGEFTLSLPEFTGEIILEVLRRDYVPTIFSVKRSKLKNHVSVELLNRELLDRMSTSLGIRQARTKSVFLGRISNGAGVSIAITNKADGPYYFNERGQPVSADQLKTTAENGRFVFFNVDAGVGYVDLQIKGETVAPMMIA